MKQIKLRLTAFLLSVSCLFGLQAQTMLFVKEKTGTQTAFELSNIRKLTFASGNMTVDKTIGGTGSYALNGIRYLSFTDFNTGVSLPEAQENGNFIIYPNPVVNELHIMYNSLQKSLVQVRIIELIGRTVYQNTITGAQGQLNATIDLSTLSEGIYICRFEYDNKVESIKFIKK